MLELFISKLHDAQFVATLLTAVAVTATDHYDCDATYVGRCTGASA